MKSIFAAIIGGAAKVSKIAMESGLLRGIAARRYGKKLANPQACAEPRSRERPTPQWTAAIPRMYHTVGPKQTRFPLE
ncbi:MAG: hypothetical protein IT167_09090 [Bryobacterales bacterium]|nr:hypothetical protein [Bryobacterales bacterium]